MPATLKHPPGPRGFPFLGQSFSYMRDPLGFVEGCVKRYGDVVQLSLGGKPCLAIVHPAQIEQVLRSDAANYHKDSLTRGALSMLGEGLILSEGDFWRRQRRLVQPAFSAQQLNGYADGMASAARETISGWADGQVIDVHAEWTRLALKVISGALFGEDVSAVTKDVSENLEEILRYLMNPFHWVRLGQALPTPATRRYRRAVAALESIVYSLIAERRKRATDSGDLLTRLVRAVDDDASGMSDKQLRDEVLTLFLAGHETSAVALSFCCHLLAAHPDAARKLADEACMVLGGRPVTAADVPRLPYAEAVVKEALRLYPPVWSMGRDALSDCELGGYFVPKGTAVSPFQWIVHRDPRWYDAPAEFRPERWENGFERRLPRCAYFPFGDGPRLCVGLQFAMMEMIIVLATLSQHVELAPVPERPLELMASITLRPKDGAWVRVKKRA